MEIVEYDYIPNDAKAIRLKVFVEEQGFHSEFDEIDEKAIHMVGYDNKKPIATCRIYWDEKMNSYILGRIAVIKEYRGRKLGSIIVKEVERYVQKKGGKNIALHAQLRITKFYQKLGFKEYGNVDEDEGCPHLWMRKSL